MISTLVILVSAEFLPKALFRIYANEMLWFFAPLAYFFYIIFHFISAFITVISSSLGLQSTLGWLCTSINEFADAFIAGLNTSLGWMRDAFSIPTDISSSFII